MGKGGFKVEEEEVVFTASYINPIHGEVVVMGLPELNPAIAARKGLMIMPR